MCSDEGAEAPADDHEAQQAEQPEKSIIIHSLTAFPPGLPLTREVGEPVAPEALRVLKK